MAKFTSENLQYQDEGESIRMNLTALPEELAVHTEWFSKESTGETSPEYVFLVNARRRKLVPVGFAVILVLMAGTFVFPSAAIWLAIATVAIVVGLALLTRGGGAGMYEVEPTGELKKLEDQWLNQASLRRVRRRWL